MAEQQTVFPLVPRDHLTVTFGGTPRRSARRVARSVVSDGRAAVVVVCGLPNTGPATMIDPSWREFAVSLNHERAFTVRKLQRRRIHAKAVEPGLVSIAVSSIRPQLGGIFEIGPGQVAIVELHPPERSAPRSGSMALQIVDASSHVVREERGHYGSD